MNDPATPAGLLEELQTLSAASGQPRTLTMREMVVGRVTIVDHTLPQGYDPFVSSCFELAEVDEALQLTTPVRVYEEVRVHTIRRICPQVVGATLRREVAEVTETKGAPTTP